MSMTGNGHGHRPGQTLLRGTPITLKSDMAASLARALLRHPLRFMRGAATTTSGALIPFVCVRVAGCFFLFVVGAVLNFVRRVLCPCGTLCRSLLLIMSTAPAVAAAASSVVTQPLTMKGTTLKARPMYLDFQATTPMDPRVLDAMLPFMAEQYGNPHSRTHFFGWESEQAVEKARLVWDCPSVFCWFFVVVVIVSSRMQTC